jgi:hypothetical protein
VCELIDAILRDDLRSWTRESSRRSIPLGQRSDGAPVLMPAANSGLLLAGGSGSGKSIYAAGILERIAQQGYQYCVIDPDGDYAALTDGVVLGNAERAPTVQEVESALEIPHTSVVVNLAALLPDERPSAFGRLATRLAALRAACGRPHWLLVGEAHRLFPRDENVLPPLPAELAGSVLYVSVHPDAMSRVALESVDMMAAIGASAPTMLTAYCAALAIDCPTAPEKPPEPGQALGWLREGAEGAFLFTMQQSESEQRHRRQRLVETDLPAERSFFFRGPKGKLNLRAQNLALFLQIGSGVDAATWLHHLRRGDYSRWLHESVQDARLAAEIAEIEATCKDAAESRLRVEQVMSAFLGGEGSGRRRSLQ